MSSLEILQQHYNKGLILDTNLLVLYVFGKCFPDKLEEWSRTRSFTKDDLILLMGILKKFCHISVTPNVLTETSNFISQLCGDRRSQCLDFFIEQITALRENYIPSSICADEPYFRLIGLSDASIAKLTEKGLVVLTVDAKLAFHLGNMNLAVVNFNHLRQLRLSPTVFN